jgi:L-seryl-tRNA(Ser) seleniumtransferase
MGRNPLMRTFRPGKTVLSLLEEILIRRIDGPAWAETVYGTPVDEVRRFGRKVLRGIPKEIADIVDATATTGGGSAPDEAFRSFSIEIKTEESPDGLLAKLRNLPVPLIGTIENGRVRLNLSTLLREDAILLRDSLKDVLGIVEES